MWTKERERKLEDLWRAGMPSSLIAAELNQEDGHKFGFLTRNAVIGKVHRLGLNFPDRRKKNPPKEHKNPNPRMRRLAGLVKDKMNGHPIMELAPLPVLAPPPAELVMRRLAVGDLTWSEEGPRECRWPIGDPGTKGFFFCGVDTIGMASYCTYHCTVAYDRTRIPTPWSNRST